MRWRLVVGFGFAGAVAGSALGQFAVDRVPATQAPAAGLPGTSPQQPPAAPIVPPGLQPVAPTSPGAYAPPVGGVMPAGGINPNAGSYPGYPTLASATNPAPQRPLTPPPRIEIESVLGPNHPWALRPETGPYFICVKSYSRPHTPTAEDGGPSARALAEALASEIRQIHTVQAFLYEYVSEERKAEAAAIAAERQRGQAFLDQMDNLKKQSTLQGMEFLGGDNMIRFKTVNYRDQIAVMVGPFQSMDDGRKALELVRKWDPPTQRVLMDSAVGRLYVNVEEGQKVVKKDLAASNGFINPYLTATVAPNPTVPHPDTPKTSRLDPAIVKWNETNPYNLLKATKSWTIAVKSFNAPVELVSKDAKTTEPTWVEKLFANKKGANALLAAAVQAETMAKMLREMKGPGGQPLGLEAFVLHTRHSSLVTVGQFDSLDDPALIQMQNLLNSMRLNVTEDKMGSKPVVNTPKLFEAQLQPMPIPRP